MAFNFNEMDSVTKFMFIALIGVISYLVFFFLLKPFVMPASSASQNSMMMGDHMMNFTSSYERNLNLISIVIAVLIGFLLSLKMKSGKIIKAEDKSIDELSIIKKALSSDEKRLIEEVEKAGEITQDSLRFRLNWSKAKVSAVVNNLDRLNILQRERQGKTYSVFVRKN